MENLLKSATRVMHLIDAKRSVFSVHVRKLSKKKIELPTYFSLCLFVLFFDTLMHRMSLEYFHCVMFTTVDDLLSLNVVFRDAFTADTLYCKLVYISCLCV